LRAARLQFKLSLTSFFAILNAGEQQLQLNRRLGELMKKPRPKTPHAVSVANQRRLTAYAAAAAGVGVLALATPSEAEVVYTPTNLELHPDFLGNPGYKLDLNGDGIADFELINSSSNFGHGGGERAKPRGQNQVLGAGIYASALESGATIGPSGPFDGATVMAKWNDSSGSFTYRGQWNGARDRYLGFRFLIQGEYHFGWARISVSTDTMKLHGYAYETVANQPITAGQESGSADDAKNISPTNSATPAATATLGRLAQGATGLTAWRREDADVVR
jgi:hypothetical protein